MTAVIGVRRSDDALQALRNHLDAVQTSLGIGVTEPDLVRFLPVQPGRRVPGSRATADSRSHRDSRFRSGRDPTKEPLQVRASDANVAQLASFCRCSSHKIDGPVRRLVAHTTSRTMQHCRRSTVRLLWASAIGAKRCSPAAEVRQIASVTQLPAHPDGVSKPTPHLTRSRSPAVDP